MASPYWTVCFNSPRFFSFKTSELFKTSTPSIILSQDCKLSHTALMYDSVTRKITEWMRFGRHYQIFTTSLCWKGRKKGKQKQYNQDTNSCALLKQLMFYCFSNHVLAPGKTKVQLSLQFELWFNCGSQRCCFIRIYLVPENWRAYKTDWSQIFLPSSNSKMSLHSLNNNK